MKGLTFTSLIISSAVTSTVAASTDLNDLFELSLEELTQVKIITAGKISEELGTIPASIVLITRRDIQRYGYTSVEDILQHVSGIYHIHAYDLTGSAQGVRGYLSTGSPNRDMIILVNGINQVSDYDSAYYLSHTPVPVEAIDRIEIVRGPQSTIYGSGAFFGVVNIITNDVDDQNKEIASYTSMSLGNRQARRGFARASYVHEKDRIVVNIGGHHDDGLDIPYGRLASTTMAGEGGLSTGGRLEMSEKYLGLSGKYGNFSFDATYIQSDTEGFMSRPVVRTGSVRKVESTHLRVGYKTDLSKELSFDSKLTYIHTPIHVDYDSFLADDPWNVQEYNTTAYEGEATLWWKSSPQLDVTVGLYCRYAPEVSVYSDIPAVPQLVSFQKSMQRLQTGNAMVNRALFSQINYYPNERWKWVAGLRLEQALGYGKFAEYGRNPEEYQSMTVHYDDQDIAIIPRLAAIYTPNDKHIYKWMYGKAINTPSFSQNQVEPGLGLVKLNPERIETVEFDYMTYLSPRYLLSANFFHSRLSNLFERIVDAENIFLGNAGQWRTNGIELSLQAQPTHETEMELSMTYQKTEDRQYSERKVAYSPRLLGQLKLGYQWTSKLSFGFTASYVSKMEVFYDQTLENPDGSLGGYVSDKPSESYMQAGINVRFRDWLTRGTFVNLRINNLFDHEVVYPVYTVNTWMDRGAIGEGRSFLLTIGYEFEH